MVKFEDFGAKFFPRILKCKILFFFNNTRIAKLGTYLFILNTWFRFDQENCLNF